MAAGSPNPHDLRGTSTRRLRHPSFHVAGGEILPDFRVVAYDGAPNAPLLGPLGAEKIDQAAAKLNQQAEAYATPKRPALPAIRADRDARPA